MAGMVGGKKVRAAAPALVAPLSSEAEEPSEEDAGLDLVGRSL